MTTRTLNRTPRRFRRTALALVGAGAALAATTLTGERQASASIGSDVAVNIVSGWIQNAISCAITDGFQSVFSTCVLTGGSNGSSLSSSDIDSIAAAIKSDLVNFNADSYQAQADTILGYVKNYYRGTSCADLGATDSGALWKVNQILSWTDNVMALASSSSMGLEGASTYYALAPIQVAFYKEKYEIMRRLNEGGCTSYTSGSLYSTGVLANALATAASKAGDAATQLETFNDLVDAEFGAVTKETTKKDISLSSPTGTCALGTWKHTSAYCFDGPSGTVCGESQTWRTYNDFWCGDDYPDGSEDATISARSKGQAEHYRRQQLMAYREEMIGIGVHQVIASFKKASESFDFEYCGNGKCAIGEIDTCATDCGSGSTAKWIEKSPGYSTSSTGDIMGAAGSTDARLTLSAYELSIQDNWLGRTRWSTKSTLSGWKDYHTVSFGTDGNLSLKSTTSYGSSTWWETATTAASSTNTTNQATRMVLLGKQLYMLNASGAVVWTSDRDPLMFAEVNRYFCYERPSSDQTILEANPLIASDLGILEHRLIWTTSGELVVREGETDKWSSGTSGTGKYFCHQEDGNLAIYSETGGVPWHANAAQEGTGGRLQLVDDQIRVTASSGDVRWGSSTCSWDTCAYGVRNLGTSYSLTQSSSDQTLLGSGSAKLVLTSSGDLRIVDRTTGATLWSAGTSGSGNKVSFSGSGILTVSNSSGSAIWTATSSAGTHVYLADCNMYIGNGSGTPVFTTGTVCDDAGGTLTVTGSDGTKTYTTAQLLSNF